MSRRGRSATTLPREITQSRSARKPKRLDRIAGVEHDEAGALADGEAEMVEAHDRGVDIGDHVEAARHVGGRGHLRHMKAHEGDVEHVGGAQRIPGVHAAVLAEADADAVGDHLPDAGEAAALGIGVVAALQHDVDQRIGDRRDLRLGDQRQQLRDVIIVHRVHGGEVRASHPALQAQPLRLVGELLDVARQRIVGLVAMHVDHQAALGGDLAELGDRARAVGHGALEMRDAADDVDAQVERADGVFARGRRTVEPVLREGDELQVDIGRDLLLHLEQRLDGKQPVVADIDMGADGEQAHRHRPVAIAERPLLHGLVGQQRLQLAPERDAFEQRAGRH